MMHKETNRNVIASTTIGYFDGVNFEIFLGEVKGTISKEIRGLNGFGWDTIFIPNGSDKTYAELKDEEKDTYSQRAIALKKFQIFLKGKM